jgi:hypothetical protein
MKPATCIGLEIAPYPLNDRVYVVLIDGRIVYRARWKWMAKLVFWWKNR